MKRNKTLAILLVVYLGLYQTAHAEISGSGSPNSGCLGQLTGVLWQDLNANGTVDSGEAGLGDVGIELVYDDDDGSSSLSATTNAAGRYQLDYLCEGDYLAVIDEATVPDGLLVPVPGDDDDDDSDEDLGGWSVEIGDDDEATVVLDLGYVGCDLAVNASCSVASLATELYSCEKPVKSLSLIWNGEQNIRVVAHRGNEDAEVLADIDNITRGDLITVTDPAGFPKDVIWEIFEAGTDIKIGKSKFHMECGDIEMDGPEDCGLSQGNGKDNKTEFINDWLLDGIVDDSGLMECTNRSVAAESCEFQGTWADCEMLGKVKWLTFSYTGGGCAASYHDQPDKFECAGQVDDDSPATVQTGSGDSFVVSPGDSFTIPVEGGDTDIELSNANGTESMRIHTSCSKPLAAGDIYGSLTLAALNGLGIGAQVDYEYQIQNKGNLAAVARTREAPFRTLFGQNIPVESNTTRTVAGSAYVIASTVSALLASDDGLNRQCSAADVVGVVGLPRVPCEISGSGWQFHDKEIRWDLGAGLDVSATIERIEVSWPTAVTDKLKEIKLDGDKIFDQDRLGGVALIEKTDLVGDFDERHLPRNESKQLKIIFDDDIDTLSYDDFEIEVQFRQGCVINW